MTKMTELLEQRIWLSCRRSKVGGKRGKILRRDPGADLEGSRRLQEHTVTAWAAEEDQRHKQSSAFAQDRNTEHSLHDKVYKAQRTQLQILVATRNFP